MITLAIIAYAVILFAAWAVGSELAMRLIPCVAIMLAFGVRRLRWPNR